VVKKLDHSIFWREFWFFSKNLDKMRAEIQVVVKDKKQK